MHLDCLVFTEMVFHANDDGKRMPMKSSDDFQAGWAEGESVNIRGKQSVDAGGDKNTKILKNPKWKYFLVRTENPARQVLCWQPTELWLRWVPAGFFLPSSHLLGVGPRPPATATQYVWQITELIIITMDLWFISWNFEHSVLIIFHNHFLILSTCPLVIWNWINRESKAVLRCLCFEGRKCDNCW